MDQSETLALVESLRTLELQGEGNAELYTTLLAGELLLGDLNSARFLWKRIPEDLKKNAVLAGVWSVGKAMWQGQRAQALALLSGALANPEGIPANVVPLLQALHHSLQAKNLELLAQSYTCIKAASAAAWVGLDLATLIKVCVDNYGWTYNEADETLNREPKIVAHTTGETGPVPIDQLTKIMTYLEK